MIDPFYLPKIKRLDIPKNINGVYFIFDNGEIIYVGQSKNIKRRLATHHIYQKHYLIAYIEVNEEHAEQRLNTKRFSKDSWIHTFEKINDCKLTRQDLLRRYLETKYIKKYKPKLNNAFDTGKLTHKHEPLNFLFSNVNPRTKKKEYHFECRSYMIHKIKFRWKDLTKEMKRKVY